MLQPPTTSDYIVLLGSAATVVTALVAVVALVYAKGQIKEAQNQLQQSRKIAQGDFLLRLDEAFQRNHEVHQKLQPAFAWGKDATGRSKGGPSVAEEWFNVSQYMGLFERVNSLLKNETVDLASIDSFYGYRLYNVVANDTIRKAKLENPELARYWENLIDLWLKLKVRHEDWEQYPGIVLIRKRQN
jgi:hypothetical protein